MTAMSRCREVTHSRLRPEASSELRRGKPCSPKAAISSPHSKTRAEMEGYDDTLKPTGLGSPCGIKSERSDRNCLLAFGAINNEIFSRYAAKARHFRLMIQV
jgi:hypothetical protein